MTALYPPPQPDVFGQILSAAHVRGALLSTIQLWSPTYIAEVSATSGIAMAPFGTWEAIYDNRALPPDQTAACWVTCTTTNPRMPPERQGNGTYRAWWLAEANIVAYGLAWDQAADLISLYMAAVRSAVIQHRDLGGFADDTRWLGEATKEVEHSPNRTIETGVVQFRVTVNGMTQDGFGPAAPSTASLTQPGPTILTTPVTIASQPVTINVSV